MLSTILGAGGTAVDKTKTLLLGFPGGDVVKNLPANTGSSPGPGRSHMPRSN